MRRKSKQQAGPNAIDLMEEAVQVVRTAPLSILTYYYLGSMPFIAGLLYFWADMGRGAGASSRCAVGSLGVALLFVWMKYWQAVFAGAMRNHVMGSSAARSSKGLFRREVRRLITQTAIQATGLIVLPLGMLVFMPIPWLYAFYQNVSVIGDGEEPAVLETMRRAWRQARLWPRQNQVCMWLLSPLLLELAAVLYLAALPIVEELAPFWASASLRVYATVLLIALAPLSPLGMAIAVNLALAIMQGPLLLKQLLGIESVFTTVDMAGGTQAAIVCGLAYLCMDPVMKTVYVLRCFYGESLRTADDLQADQRALPPLKRIVLGGVILALGCCAAGQVFAAEPVSPTRPFPTAHIEPDRLDRAIAETILQREYTWRMPRDESIVPEIEEGPIGRFMEQLFGNIKTWLKTALEWVGKLLQKLIDWVTPDRFRDTSDGELTSWMAFLRGFVYALVAGIAAAITLFLFRLWRRNQQESLEVAAFEAAPQVDIQDENVRPDALPESQWAALARELLQQGEMRLALRAVFLACLAMLGDRGLIVIARFKSNREYERELVRRAHAAPGTLDAFRWGMRAFEGVWYGTSPATEEAVEELLRRYERMRELGGAFVQEASTSNHT